MDYLASQSETVTILKSQYEDLLRVARQFENLRESLLRGGVSQEDLDVLVNDAVAPLPVVEESVQKSYHQNQQSSNGTSPAARKPPTGPASTNFRPNYKLIPPKTHKHDPYPTGDSIEEEDDDEQELEELEDRDPQTDEQQEQSPAADGPDDDDEQHTIEMRNLPDRCTHFDITRSICGGALVQIYVRFIERMARVTFVDAAAAREFLARGKRIGFYIHNQKVDLSWSDREFSLRPYIKQSITHNGATRNLIIRNTNANITPALIREHLDHIHNLIVINIKIDHTNRSICICTNSVHNAMFARSCMRSRATYKGMKIDFGVDECAAPWSSSLPPSGSSLSATAPEYHASSSTSLPRVKGRREMQQQQQRQGSAGRSLSNRFDLLSLDSGTDSDEGQESDDPDS
ncbi:hypothetical protein ZTR_07152 [Talaromyces verruculosus]|nr:hypothetical protein ZTR_07152 [Talaromyces verruculosus]